MATKNIEINIKNSTNTYDQLYPQTNSSNIIMSGGENLDDYISSDRQYKVGDTLTTARPTEDFSTEWMLCNGDKVPSGYLINNLLSNDIGFSEYYTTHLPESACSNFVQTPFGIIGLCWVNYYEYHLLATDNLSSGTTNWKLNLTLKYDNKNEDLFYTNIYYNEDNQTYFFFGFGDGFRVYYTKDPSEGIIAGNRVPILKSPNQNSLVLKINSKLFLTGNGIIFYSDDSGFTWNYIDLYSGLFNGGLVNVYWDNTNLRYILLYQEPEITFISYTKNLTESEIDSNRKNKGNKTVYGNNINGFVYNDTNYFVSEKGIGILKNNLTVEFVVEKTFSGGFILYGELGGKFYFYNNYKIYEFDGSNLIEKGDFGDNLVIKEKVFGKNSNILGMISSDSANTCKYFDVSTRLPIVESPEGLNTMIKVN